MEAWAGYTDDLVLHNKLPQSLKQLRTMHDSYLIMSVYQESRHSLSGFSASGSHTGCNEGVKAGVSAVTLN